jgi:hypothetical protein
LIQREETLKYCNSNESLGSRDVQSILAYSARHVGSAVDAWHWNSVDDWKGGTLHFSNDYR